MALARTGQRWTLATVVVLAAFAAGCTTTTYGTGRTAGLQTIEDLASIVSMSSQEQEPIDYRNRPPVVAPPQQTAALPAPGQAPRIQSNDWPDDPDVRRQQVLADIAEQEAELGPGGQNRYNPRFRLPRGATPAQINQEDPSVAARVTQEEAEAARKAFASARANAGFDENGNPVRRYLTDPPVEYRVPDPNAPVAVEVCEDDNKFRWPWQKKPDGC